MRLLSFALAAVLCLAAAPSFASFGGGKKSDAPASTDTPQEKAALTPRQEAERWYSDAFEEVTKAKKDAAEGKTKGVEKRWQKALDRGLRATELDPKYHEAWNLVGYTSRMLGKFDASVDAYLKSIALKPDYAAAREYLGESYVELGKLAEAKEQLAWLDKLNAAEDAKTLRAAIEAKEAKSPAASEGDSK